MQHNHTAAGRRRRSAATALAAACSILLGLVAATPAAAQAAVPDGYRVVERRDVAPGVEHQRLVREEPPIVVHVARVSRGAPVALRTVLSNDKVGGPGPLLERTSEMCHRTRCVVAVNGDFYLPGTGEPIGGAIAGGQLLRSPVDTHHQLSAAPDGSLTAGTLDWSGRVVSTDLREIAIGGVNVAREADGLVLYTPAHGATTGTNPHGAELDLRLLQPASPLRLGQTALVEMAGFREGAGDSALGDGRLVLSGHGEGAAALRELWGRVQDGRAGRQALLRLEAAGGVVESVGGSPVLVREGRRWVGNDGSGFVAGRHPRTIVGWNHQGDLLLVAVDGRQPGYSVGLALREAADLLARLGATEGINLDGGGSTTLAIGGTVVNQPSDRLVLRDGRDEIVAQPRPDDVVVGPVERPVTDALAVVATTPLSVLGDLLGPTLPPSPPGVRAPGSRDDPASNPAS